MTRLFTAMTLCLALPISAQADEIKDALTSAAEAYAAGDIQFAIEELDFARSKLLALKTDALGAYLPEAPAGWSREVNTEMNAALGLMGGGVGAEAEYTTDTGARFKLTLMADNPMVSGMAGMIANAAAMGMRLERAGRQRIAVNDRQVMAMVANRILVQAEGADAEVMLNLVKTIDFAAMGQFGT